MRDRLAGRGNSVVMNLDVWQIIQAVSQFLLEKYWLAVVGVPLYCFRYYLYGIYCRIRYSRKAVFVAIEGQKGLAQTYGEEIQEKVIHDLQAHPALKRLHVIPLPGVIRKKSINSVEAFRQLSGCLVIIWGKITADGLKVNGEQVHEPSISYTFLCPRDTQNILPKVISTEYAQVAKITEQKIIQEKDSLEHLKLCSKNISLTAQYIIGSTILLMGNLISALEIFEPLYNASLKEDKLFLAKVKFRLVNCYDVAIEQASSQKKWLFGIEMCRRLLFLVKDSRRALIGLPFFLEQINDFDGALKAVANLKKYYPKLPITIVDEAYIHLRAGKFQKAIGAYHKLRKAQLDFNQLDVIEFLDQKIKAFPTEIQLKFGLGFMYYFFVSEDEGKQILLDFIASATDQSFKAIRDEGQRIANGNYSKHVKQPISQAQGF